MSFPDHQNNIAIKSSRHLPGWSVSGRASRKAFISKGYVVRPDATKHREFKAKKGKKVDKTPPSTPVYPNPLFTPWQKEMATAIHNGHNIIADVPTSCGKTWTANLTVAYEILSTDSPTGAKDTALIFSPNSEVMRDTVRDICERHVKFYNYATKMLDTITRNYVSYDEKRGPSCQIMVIAVECAEEFITDPVNAAFVKNLRFIIFDEVHLGPVTRTLWWSQYIPHTAQLILLSATLGNPAEAQEIVQSLQANRPRETTSITYNVRPIPLQPLLFKGCPTPEDGVLSSSLKGIGALSCVVNQFDPTIRDIKSLAGLDVHIPETREEQYYMGLEVVARNMNLVSQKLESALETAHVEPTVENVYSLLCYLFSNEKQPVMVFNTTAEATELLARTMVSHIANIENSDPAFRTAQKHLDVYEKEHYRTRDAKTKAKKTKVVDGKRGGNDQSKAREKARDDWSQPSPSDPSEDTINIHEIHKTLGKWRFRADIEVPANMPQWIKDCLEYGIGIYVSTMKVWQRHFMFDAFRQGKLLVLMSDSSISVGINLPIRTCVLCGYVSHTLYRQASGRAGRRGLDTQGFIVHLMPKDDIRKCLTTSVPEVHLHMPEMMTYADLIGLLVPANLDAYYVGTDLAVNLADHVPAYKKHILETYLASLSATDRESCLKQISLIHKEQWHYHRLTNMIKTLPEATSIIVIKLLVSGILHEFEVKDFINLMSVLFYRVEAPDSEVESVAKAEDYYVPTFDKFPDLLERLQKISDTYNLDIDFSRPVHRYFSDFCRKRIIHMDYLSELESMGEWLYIFKRGIESVAPYDKRSREYRDTFTKTIGLVDHDYLAARACRSI